MKSEQEIREVLRKESQDWNVPASIRHEVMKGVQSKRITRPSRLRYRIAVLAVAVMLILPVGAYAGYQYLADSIYGASGNGIAFRGDLTEYEHLEDKLQAAQAQLSEADYARLEKLLQQVAALQASIDKAGGQDAMSTEQIQQLKSLEQQIAEISPGSIAPKDPGKIVSEEEFWNPILIEAQKSFSSNEYEEVKRLITLLRTYQSKTDEASSLQADQTLDELNSHLEKIGHKIKVGF